LPGVLQTLRGLIVKPFSYLCVIILAFSSYTSHAQENVVFDDMEHGNPLGNGWFVFGGSAGGGGIGPNDTDLPPSDGGAFSLETGWGSGGIPGFFGGFGRTNLVDLSETDHFSFWINPDPGQDYVLELNLQDDDDGDDAVTQPNDDEFQFNCVISPTGPCAISGGGWQKISIPLADFFDDNSFLFGGNGVLDAVAPSNGGNGQLINVVIAVISNSGADVTFRTDYWAFSSDFATLLVDDFESGVAPAGPCSVLPLGFCTFFGAGSSVAISTQSTPPAPLLPAASDPNSVLQIDLDVTSFAGFTHGFANETLDTWVSQDWSAYEGISFWLHGNGSGTDLFVDLIENRNPGSTTDDAERWTVAFVDDFFGWKKFYFPFSDFQRKEIGNGAPNDGLYLTEVHGWAFGTLGTGGPRTYYIDEFRLRGSDSDGDGVFDGADLCPGTEGGDPVDANGCSDIQVDRDGDGACDPGAASNGPSACTGTDAFPDNSTETSDNDDDGTGDNADTDDDNDRQSDADEVACGSDPLDANSTSPDFDNDDIPDCVDSDDDGDNVDDNVDQCANTVIPEAAPTSSHGLVKNRWALTVEGSTEFTQAPPQQGAMFSFTTTDTRGCSCAQIVEAQRLGNNHLSRGCSTGVMLVWIKNQ
jgi:hypothetical protein